MEGGIRISIIQIRFHNQQKADAEMTIKEELKEELCIGCVYYPPNLPQHAYSTDDYTMLQQKDCSFDHAPGEQHCLETRKTSCSVVDMQKP